MKPLPLGNRSLAASAVIVAALLSFPAIGWLALRAVQSNENRVADWLPPTYEETRQLRWFRERFVADQFLVISWDGCRLGEDPTGTDDDPRIARLTAALRRARLPSSEHGDAPLAFRSATNGRETLIRLSSPPSDLSNSIAAERLSGTLIGPDGRQTCVFVELSNEATRRLHETIQSPRRVGLDRREATLSPLFAALKEADVSADEVHLGGPVVDSVAIDEEGEKTLVSLAALSSLLGVGLAWWSLRNIRMTALVFLCGVSSSALALAVIALTGGAMDAILMSMPALIYVLAVSGALHFLNYYRIAVAERGVEHAVGEACSHAWRPALLCSVTTACGLLSLLASDITPIRRFGVYSASGVLATLVVLFSFLPATLVLWPWNPPVSRDADGAPQPGWFWHGVALFIEKHYKLVLTGCFATIAALACGLQFTTTSVDLLKLFSPDTQIIQDYHWFEDRLGRLVPAELVVRFPAALQRERLLNDAMPRTVASSYTYLERMELVKRVESAIRLRLGSAGTDLVGATMSAATFAPEIKNRGGFVRSGSRYAINAELLEARANFADTGFLYIDPQTDEELWRITVRCAAFHKGQRDEIVATLRSAVEPILTGSKAASLTLANLAHAVGEDASARHIGIYSPKGDSDAVRSAGALLRGRSVRIGVLAKPYSQADAATRDAFVKQDGVLTFDATRADVAELRQAGCHVTSNDELQAESDVDIVYTGVLPIVYKAQRELLNSLIQSTWWSFATILPLMAFVCRSMLGGILVMLPNALPVLVVFGGMAWLGVSVDIGSMMAASIALGVAVDDTIHFLAWYRDDVKFLGNRAAAVVSAYQRSATPTLQAGLVNGLGLSVFALSSFMPTQRFGLIMLAILAAGVVAELIMLPALLLSPLGRVFDRASGQPTDPASRLGAEQRLERSRERSSLKLG